MSGLDGPWGPDGAPSSWDVSIPTDDASIMRRRRALAPIQVLNDLERNKAGFDGGFWDYYDLFSIALGVIDQVALAMGISAGRTWDEVLDYATGEARRQVPGGVAVQHRQVAERILVTLVTTDVEKVPYLVQTPDGPQWKQQRFKLLFINASGADAVEHLRASEQAINIFVNALDLDIEAAQIANEAQLQALIERGAVESATQLAQVAQYQSAQYLERTRRIIADTFLDPSGHDWVSEVPAMLEAALAHVADRLTAEAALTDALSEQRRQVDDPAKLAHVNDLLSRLRDCRHRHDALHLHLISARSRHREAVEGRLARPSTTRHRFDIAKDLLDPYLQRPTAVAAVAAERITATVGGISARWWPSLAVVTDELCAPARGPGAGEAYDEPEFDDTEPSDWWEPYEDTVDSMFAGIDEPIRLSQLIERADDVAAAVSDSDGEQLDPRRLRSAIVHAGHRAWAAHLSGRADGDRIIVGVADTTRITSGGVSCADLILVPGTIGSPEPEPECEPAALEEAAR